MPFSTFALAPELLKGVKELGFTRPTPIQEQALPPALEGRDVLACAMTGSGKTAAFLLPMIHRFMGRPRGITRGLILTPTRELAAQIHAHLEELAVHTPVTGATVFGGVGMGPQEHALRSGLDVIVATPGRLLDHLKRPYARFTALEVLVIDEADRMLDMGFLPDVRRILKQLPRKRQTLFFSATLPKEIVGLASEMLQAPVTINLERKSAPAVGITQAVYPVPRELKSALLLDLLRQDVVADAIVFTRTKHRANRLAAYLSRGGIAAAQIHGNRSQNQRTAALDGFKAGKHRVLVATDIMARGIDVEALGHVINFDVPADPDAYIHRVGRTARAEATGDAFTFVSPDEDADLRGIERALGRRLPRVTLPGFDYQQQPRERLELPLGARHAGSPARRGAAPAGQRRNRPGPGGTARSGVRGHRETQVQRAAPRQGQGKPAGHGSGGNRERAVSASSAPARSAGRDDARGAVHRRGRGRRGRGGRSSTRRGPSAMQGGAS